MDHPLPARRVQRVRHELRRRDVEVRRVERLSAGFASVTFAGDDLASFVSDSFDDHVKLMLDGPGGEPVRRDYTPRRFDPARRELVIEFALHGHGLASDWARQAAVGQRVSVGGPRGSMIIPADYDWHLLAGDATALPAIRRRLEELPREAHAIVIAQVAPADRLPLASKARVDAHWVSGTGELLSTLRAIRWPEGEGFAWCAGEASAVPRIRELLREEKMHPREAMRVAAYWKQGASSHHENLDD